MTQLSTIIHVVVGIYVCTYEWDANIKSVFDPKYPKSNKCEFRQTVFDINIMT